MFKVSDPKLIREKLQNSTKSQLYAIKKEIEALDSLGKLNKRERNKAADEILNKVGFADIRASLNIENISLRIGQTKDLAKLYQLNHDIKKTDNDLSELKGSVEAFNSLAASDFIPKVKDEGLSMKLILEFHSLILEGTDIEQKHIGAYRKTDVEVSKGELGKLEVCPALDVEQKIRELCSYFNNTEETDPIILGAWLQHELSKIHPFIDGNGRTCRKLTDWVLQKFDYFPFHIGDISKSKYYDLLDAADTGDYNPLINHMSDLQLENVTIYRTSIENTRESRSRLFDDIKFVKNKVESKQDVNYVQWKMRYLNLIKSFTNIVFDWNDKCEAEGIPSIIKIYPKKILDQDTWSQILKNGSMPRSTAFNLDFLEIVDGRYKPKFAAQAFFSKHLSQVHIKNEYPDEVKINNSRSPFTETVGLYFGGYRNDLDQENWKAFHTNYIQPLKHRRVIYKTPVSDSNIQLRGIVQVYLKDKENLFVYKIKDQNVGKTYQEGEKNNWQWEWDREKFEGTETDIIAADYIKDIIRQYILKSE